MVKVLTGLVQLDFLYMDELEDFEWTEGDVTRIGTLERAEVENLTMNVRLVLTKRHQQKPDAALQPGKGNRQKLEGKHCKAHRAYAFRLMSLSLSGRSMSRSSRLWTSQMLIPF